MEFGLKCVHMARYELILRLDGALWLRIILKPLLTPKGAFKTPKIPKHLSLSWKVLAITIVHCQLTRLPYVDSWLVWHGLYDFVRDFDVFL